MPTMTALPMCRLMDAARVWWPWPPSLAPAPAFLAQFKAAAPRDAMADSEVSGVRITLQPATGSSDNFTSRSDQSRPKCRLLIFFSKMTASNITGSMASTESSQALICSRSKYTSQEALPSSGQGCLCC
ncbi:hypothetical protein KC19_10G012000 [Ceratodon purpureus]|uniref:Uncharacterized protein n=1 Tax=Ceratodon purpureus TaxID=3225 RepID=A0A8T0GHZ2_CERPU|nr:hypothetical protein KC19_10G012000 [Ceratodon purpureus]